MQLEKDTKKNFPWRACLIFLILASVATYLVINHDTAKEGKDPKKGGKDISTVVTENVTLGDMPIYLHGLGTVSALRTVIVKSRVDGELLRVHYKEGENIKAGDLLAEIDPRSFDIQVMQAEGQLQRDEALLKNAQLDLQRYKILLAQDSIAAQQVATQDSLVKQYQGTVATDKAAVANAKLQLSYTKISAPISGRLGLRLVDQGNMVKATDTQGLAVITQVQPISVIFTLPEDALSSLKQKQGLIVEAFDRSNSHKLAEGQLSAIDNQIDLTTGTIKLKSQFANTDNALFVNQFVNVRMLIDTLHNIPIISSSAVQNGEKGSFVYVLKPDKTVSVRPVKLGESNGDKVAILDGLSPQDTVIIDGIDKLREGIKVKLAGEDKPEQPEKHHSNKK